MDTAQIKQYGRYQIQSQIGSGSMGVVYRALDPKIDRVIALKVLRQDRVTESEVVKRFQREAKAAGRLSQPNIVAVHDIGQDHGTVYIAMELVEGKGLDRIMEKGPLPLKQAIDITCQAAVALDYAHRQGVVHRDIKPGNIIITPDGKIKITDFGIARMVDAPRSEQTQIGSILGTPSYMSPEQACGERADGRSDLFSLGIILYEMITGEKPFQGSDFFSVIQAISNAEPPPLSTYKSDVSEELQVIISKVLNKDPDARFQGGTDLSDALLNCSIGIASELPTVLNSETVVSGVKHKRLLGPLIIIAATVTIVIIVAFWWFTHTSVVDMGKLYIHTNPVGSAVTIDGVSYGHTPLIFSLKAGTYDVILTKTGYYPSEVEVKIETAKTVPLELNMVRKDVP